MTRKTKVIAVLAIFVIFAIMDFWRGFHEAISIRYGVLTAIGGIVGGLLLFFSMWPGPHDRHKKHDSSGTLV